MKEERREEGRGGQVIRTDADEGKKEKFQWEGEGEILIWRGKRERRVVGGFKPFPITRCHWLDHGSSTPPWRDQRRIFLVGCLSSRYLILHTLLRAA